MKKSVAKKVLALGRRASGFLDQAAYVLKTEDDEAVFRERRLAIGQCMAEIDERLFQPIFAEHPELFPREWMADARAKPRRRSATGAKKRAPAARRKIKPG